MTRIQSGPNTDVIYFTSPPSFSQSDTAYLHPALYPPPIAQGADSIFWADQDGVPGGTCTAAQFDTLRIEAERHEGLTQTNNSHYGSYNVALTTVKVQDSVERLVVPAGDSSRARLAAQGFVLTWWLERLRLDSLLELQDRTYIYSTVLHGCQRDYTP